MTPSVISTYDICLYFQKGDIVTLPDDHIKIILHKFFSRLQRGLSAEETKQTQKDCIKTYINNHDLMTERYLNIMNKQRTVAKQNRLNNSEQTKEEINKKAKI
jgi:hypothetical protein